MARRNAPGGKMPAQSRKSITHVVAYARKATPDEPPGEGEAATSDDTPVENVPADESITSPGGQSEQAANPAAGAPIPGDKVDPGSETGAKKGEPKVEKSRPDRDEPATVAAPEPAKAQKVAPAPVVAPAHAPVAAAEPLGPIYEPLLKPKEIPVEDPEMAAPPPGLVPRGDSRSFRREAGAVEEFVLVYRYQTFVISRAGLVGKRGRWKVVEYPTMGNASHAYAQECSRLVSQGFADFRG